MKGKGKAVARIIASDMVSIFHVALSDYTGDLEEDEAINEVESLSQSAERRIDFTDILPVGGRLVEVIDDAVILEVYKGAFNGIKAALEDESLVEDLIAILS